MWELQTRVIKTECRLTRGIIAATELSTCPHKWAWAAQDSYIMLSDDAVVITLCKAEGTKAQTNIHMQFLNLSCKSIVLIHAESFLKTSSGISYLRQEDAPHRSSHRFCFLQQCLCVVLPLVSIPDPPSAR